MYSLSKRSAALIGAAPNGIKRANDSFLIGDKFVAHQLAINQVYCQACFSTYIEDRAVKSWQTFSKPISPSIPLIPDAYCEISANGAVRPMFLEVDLGTEGSAVWQKKIDQYLSLAVSGEFERTFGHPRFGVMVVSTSEKRLSALRGYIRKATQKIFYLTTLEKINAHGFYSPIWLRPDGEQTQSLT